MLRSVAYEHSPGGGGREPRTEGQGCAHRDAPKAINPITSQKPTERQQLKLAEQVTGVDRCAYAGGRARISDDASPYYRGMGADEMPTTPRSRTIGRATPAG